MHPATIDRAPSAGNNALIKSNIPARLDRLPWSAWRWRFVFAWGVAWVLDGLEVALGGSLGAVLERPESLGMSAGQVGASGSLYIGGAVLGALFFGRLADRLGRKKLFLTTLTVYMVATLATALAPDYLWFAVCRAATGFGIGGEYAAINSAIDELIPARLRGRVNLGINGSFWIGAALGAALSLILLDPRVLGPALGWRVCFLLGAIFAAVIVLVRRHVPESPRWLLSHHRAEEAECVVTQIEAEIEKHAGTLQKMTRTTDYANKARGPSLAEVTRVLFIAYRQRSFVALALMVAQAFFYNAIFFTYALVLSRFYGVADDRVALYIFPFALGNVLGPVLLGPLFDSVGRRRMIAATYILSGLGLALTGWAFVEGLLDARTQVLCWSGIFFLASAAASSAYLTVSEVFPLEMRALAIAVFYAIGTGVGGALAPILLGVLIQTGSRGAVTIGWLIGAVLMVGVGSLSLVFGVNAERKALEDIASPLGVGSRESA